MIKKGRLILYIFILAGLILTGCSSDESGEENKNMIQTVLGIIEGSQTGITLSHEHILVGFVPDGKLDDSYYDADEVIEEMVAYLNELKKAGVDTFVDATPAYLGRDPYVLKELSERTGLNIITNTGYYQAPYLPAYAYEMTYSELADIWIEEAKNGIGDSGIKPGFIKIALNTGRLIPVQEKILRAAIETSTETGLVIQAHTIGGEAIIHVLEIMEETDFDPGRFIWVHADTEKDISYHITAAKRGMWIELDTIGTRQYSEHFILIDKLLKEGLQNSLLLSQDAGWYNVGQIRGGRIRPYHKIITEFIPLAEKWGLDRDVLNQIMTQNPQKAFALR
jgi:predicted metal-dependent phosphotriesterase family hydrolase